MKLKADIALIEETIEKKSRAVKKLMRNCNHILKGAEKTI